MAKRWIKNTIVGVVIVALIGGGTYGYIRYSKASANATTTTFRLVSVTQGDIDQSVSGSGTVSSGAQLTLTAANAGSIDSMPIKLGDTITAGTTVAHISETASQEQVSSNQSALQSAKDSLAQAKQGESSIYLKAPIAGRIKDVTVQSGDDLSTMRAVNNGILCTISTDGKMKTSINASGLNVGDTVKVKYNSTAVSGTVTSTSGSSLGNGGGNSGSNGSSSGNVTIIIDRDDWPVNASVTIMNNDGTDLGTGTLSINSPISIQGNNSGIVKEVLCSENQKVSKNTKLFKFDDSSVQSQIQRSQQQVIQAQNQLANSEQNAAKDTVTTPIDGVVSQLNVKNGDSVTAGEALATIVDPAKMQVVVSIDELDITKVTIGQAAAISLDALPGNSYTGEVTQIDSIGNASNGVTTYNVTVSIDNATDVKVGMNATATVVIKSVQNVLTLPASAVQNIQGTTGEVLMASSYFDASGNSVTLKNADLNTLLSKNGKQVRLGFKNADTVEIVSGLSAGDQVAVPRTISQAMINSLSNTTSNSMQTAFGGMGGMGGLNGMGGANFNRQRTGGTGSTGGNGGSGGYGGTGSRGTGGGN